MNLSAGITALSLATLAIALPLLGAGCNDSPASLMGTADNGSRDSMDQETQADVSVADASEEAEVEVDVDVDVDVTDGASGPDILTSEDVLPNSLELLPLVVDWAWQSTPSAGGIQHREALVLDDGDIVVAFAFRDEVVIEGITLGGLNASHLNGVMRIGPTGDVSYAVETCAACVGTGASQPDGSLLFGPRGGGPGGFTAVSPDGIVERADGAEHLKWTVITAMASAPDGGWLVAGRHADHAHPLVVGRLNGALELQWVEVVTGDAQAEATVVMAAEGTGGEGFFVLGSFGFYPNGRSLVFGGSETLSLKSADDDPAYDVFAARWNRPGDLKYATMVQHYENSPRPRTLVELEANKATFRLDSAKELTETDGVFGAGYGDMGYALRVELDAAGKVTDTYSARPGALPWPGAAAYVSVESPQVKGQPWVLGEGGPSFTTPADDGGTRFTSHIFSHATPAGVIKRAGQLIAEEVGSYPTVRELAVPQEDGSWIVLLRGTTDLTLGDGGPVFVNPGVNERMVFARVRFGASPE